MCLCSTPGLSTKWLAHEHAYKTEYNRTIILSTNWFVRFRANISKTSLWVGLKKYYNKKNSLYSAAMPARRDSFWSWPEVECNTVDAKAEPRREWSVVEDVSQVGVALFATHFRSCHTMWGVFFSKYVRRRFIPIHRSKCHEEWGPSTVGDKFVLGAK